MVAKRTLLVPSPRCYENFFSQIWVCPEWRAADPSLTPQRLPELLPILGTTLLGGKSRISCLVRCHLYGRSYEQDSGAFPAGKAPSIFVSSVATQPQLNGNPARGKQMCSFTPHCCHLGGQAFGPPLCRGCAPATPPGWRPCSIFPSNVSSQQYSPPERSGWSRLCDCPVPLQEPANNSSRHRHILPAPLYPPQIHDAPPSKKGLTNDFISV